MSDVYVHGVDIVHDHIHDGDYFKASYVFRNYTASGGTDQRIANGATADLLIAPGATTLHFTFEVVAGGLAFVSLYEAPTVTTNGTAVTVYCSQRLNPTTSQVSVFRGPTISATGSIEIVSVMLPGTTGGARISGAVRQGTEIVLSPGKVYLLRVLNFSGQTENVGISAEWYIPHSS